MPELPEVESTVQYLKDRVTDLKISNIKVFWPKTISSHTPIKFSKALTGSTISFIFRRGKYIGIRLNNRTPLFLFIHLRMSGSLDVLSAKNPAARHDRVLIEFTSGKSLRFNDTRKFGRMYLFDKIDALDHKIGIEPLSESFTPEVLHKILVSKKRMIKPLLLDQKLIAGLGNIYVDESLWKARINPRSLSRSISFKQSKDLHDAIRTILSDAITKLGTDFGDGVVEGGMYSPKVYGRAQQNCKRCKSKIVRTVVGQRGTYLCPKCQVC